MAVFPEFPNFKQHFLFRTPKEFLRGANIRITESVRDEDVELEELEKSVISARKAISNKMRNRIPIGVGGVIPSSRKDTEYSDEQDESGAPSQNSHSQSAEADDDDSDNSDAGSTARPSRNRVMASSPIISDQDSDADAEGGDRDDQDSSFLTDETEAEDDRIQADVRHSTLIRHSYSSDLDSTFGTVRSISRSTSTQDLELRERNDSNE